MKRLETMAVKRRHKDVCVYEQVFGFYSDLHLKQ